MSITCLAASVSGSAGSVSGMPLRSVSVHPFSDGRTLTWRCRIATPVEFVNVIPTNVGQMTPSNCADNDSSRNGTGPHRGGSRSGIAGQPWVVFRQAFEPEAGRVEDGVL